MRYYVDNKINQTSCLRYHHVPVYFTSKFKIIVVGHSKNKNLKIIQMIISSGVIADVYLGFILQSFPFKLNFQLIN